jgi:hypothetical protein
MSTFCLLMQLDVLCFELQAKGSILVPRSALVSDLKREACAELFLQEDTVGHDRLTNLSLIIVCSLLH